MTLLPYRTLHRFPHSTARGFTMVELLVVVTVVGLIATIATVAIFSDSTHQQLRRLTAQLQGQVELMAEEAQLNGATIGLLINRDEDDIWSYRWRTELAQADRQADQTEADWWLPLAGEARQLFPPISFPAGVELELRFADVNGPPVDIDDDEPVPQVLFFRNGEITPFQLQLISSAGDSHFQLQGDLLGRVEMVDRMDDSQQ
ncbi:type II secretion system minor pseudopilin GspH [bacterium SCSIO 12696]|nr:type II secretion system minor pseudopilin GspH [bacterium SCSIO 12696]